MTPDCWQESTRKGFGRRGSGTQGIAQRECLEPKAGVACCDPKGHGGAGAQRGENVLGDR